MEQCYEKTRPAPDGWHTHHDHAPDANATEATVPAWPFHSAFST